MNHFKKVGGDSIVDPSPIGIRLAASIKKFSEATDVNIICATGLYHVMGRPSEYVGLAEEQQIALFEKEINDGMDDTDVKPVFLKCALETLSDDKKSIHEVEMTTLKACAKVAAKTGMSMHVHTNFPVKEHILNAIDTVLDIGVKSDKLVMLHMDGPTWYYI